MTHPDATHSSPALSTRAKWAVGSLVLLLALAALFLLDRTRYRPLDARSDPNRASETYALEPDPLVLVTASPFRSAKGRLPSSVIFALWPDGHGYFCDPAPTPRPAHFRFQLDAPAAAALAREIVDLVRAVDRSSIDFECDRSITTTVRDGDAIRSFSTDQTFYLPASIAHHRASNPTWPAGDPYATDPVHRAAIEAQLALQTLLTNTTSGLRATATSATISRVP